MDMRINMSLAKFVIMVISDCVNCPMRKDLEDKVLKVIQDCSYALAEYYDQLSKEDISENVILVIVAKNLKDGKVVQRVRDYFDKGGNVLTFEDLGVGDLESIFEDISDFSRITRGVSGGSWITSAKHPQVITEVDLFSMLSAIRHPKFALRKLSKALQSTNPPDFELFTRANLFGTNDETDSFKTILTKSCINHQLKLEKLTLDISEDNEAPRQEDDPREFVKVTIASPKTFDWIQYNSILKTRLIGRPIIHTDLTRSTMNFFDSLNFFKHGLVVIADRQANGKGRGGNTWLSPDGCAMFSLHLETSTSLYVSILQHLAALAVVHSIRTRPGYENLDIRLKWPNDIYFGRSIKLGGVLVFCSFFKGKVMANIGLGINLDNDYPTTSINQIIAEHSNALSRITREDLLASTFNQLERLMCVMTEQNGFQEIEKLYYRYWLHENQTIRMQSEEHPESEINGVVKGIDDSGYLLVEVESSGKVVSVVPGDNSFDMMQGLIIPKSQK